MHIKMPKCERCGNMRALTPNACLNEYEYQLLNFQDEVLKPMQLVRGKIYRWWTCTSKHGTLNQCWWNAGPPSQTLDHHSTSIGITSRVSWTLLYVPESLVITSSQAAFSARYIIAMTNFGCRLRRIYTNTPHASPRCH